MFRNRSLDDLTENLTRLEDNYLSNIPRVATLESRMNVVDKHMLSLEARWDKHLKTLRHEEGFIDSPNVVPGIVGSLTAHEAEGAPLYTESPAPLPAPSVPQASSLQSVPSPQYHRVHQGHS